MLQDKIDKIGAFRFTIKGWSVTVVIAGTITTSGKGLAVAGATTLGLLVLLLFFLLLEDEQERLKRLYGGRAVQLEDVFRRIADGKGEEAFRTVPVPYTAHDSILAVLKEKSRGRWAERTGRLRKKPGIWRRVGPLHTLFYVMLMLLSMGPLAAQHKQIAKSIEDFRQISGFAEKPTPSPQPVQTLPRAPAGTLWLHSC